MKILYSIGHSNKKEEELIEILQVNEISDLVDIRTYPSSKYNPQFNRVQLERYLPKFGIRYHWKGRNLGGLQGNTLFKETIKKILESSSDERKICLMCSEGKPEDCHRSQTIEPVVEEFGGKMVHILWTSKKGNDIIKTVPKVSLFDSLKYKN